MRMDKVVVCIVHTNPEHPITKMVSSDNPKRGAVKFMEYHSIKVNKEATSESIKNLFCEAFQIAHPTCKVKSISIRREPSRWWWL